MTGVLLRVLFIGDEMQDKYVGDIGDYGKFGLLRALFHQSQLSARLVEEVSSLAVQ